MSMALLLQIFLFSASFFGGVYDQISSANCHLFIGKRHVVRNRYAISFVQFRWHKKSRYTTQCIWIVRNVILSINNKQTNRTKWTKWTNTNTRTHTHARTHSRARIEATTHDQKRRRKKKNTEIVNWKIKINEWPCRRRFDISSNLSLASVSFLLF